MRQADRDLPALVEQLLGAASPAPPATPSGPPSHSSAAVRLQVPPPFDEPQGEGNLLPDGRLIIKLPKALQRRVRQAAGGWDYEAPTSIAQPLGAGNATGVTGPGPAPSGPPTPGPSRPPVPSGPEPPVPAGPEPLAGGQTAQPETVRIPELGQYEIDVRRLLEKSPIVIQKDGTYLLHLPSLFEMPRRPGTR